MIPSRPFPLLALLAVFSCLAISCREARKETKISRSQVREESFSERKELARCADVLRRVRELAGQSPPDNRVSVIAAHLASLDETNLPAEIKAAVRGYKQAWSDFAAAKASGRNADDLAELARATDTSGKVLRDAMAGRGFVEIGL